jgi:hypothetical protein
MTDNIFSELLRLAIKAGLASLVLWYFVSGLMRDAPRVAKSFFRCVSKLVHEYREFTRLL